MIGSLRWILAVAVWAGVVLGGFTVLFRYKSTPGLAADAPAVWPEASHLARAPRGPTLLVFVHPQCSCSRASLAELRSLLSHAHGSVAASVVFVRPPGAPSDFAETSLDDTARAIPGVTVVDDENATEAHRFRVATSGTALLYDAHARLRFAGGITGLRGHEGDNIGEERLLAMLNEGHADRADSPVFGCGLDDPDPGRPTDGR